MKIRRIRIIFLAIYLAITAVYVISPKVRGVQLQGFDLIFPVGAALIALYASRIYGFRSANGRTQLLIAGGLACWGVGEILFWVFANIMNISPFPSLADFFFLLAYPLLGAGIYQGYVTAEIKLKMVKKSLLAIVLSASLILAILVGYFGVYQVYDSSADLVSNVINICYGLGDLILIIASLLTILVASEYKGGKLATFWKTITAGFFITLIADILFAMYGAQYSGDIKPYSYIDLLWIAGYLVLAYGVLENYLHISAVQKNIKLKLQQRK